MNLSKSLYTKGIQCQKALWLKKHKKEVLTAPGETEKYIFETGNVVGEKACELFPNGKEIAYTKDFEKMISETKKYINQGVKNIYEATFSFDNILVLVDILVLEGDGVHIYEVKSSTSVREIYLHDASIQYYVLKNLGYKIKSTNIVHINNKYIRKEKLEINELFKIVDISDEVLKKQKVILSNLKSFSEMLEAENEPNIDIGKHCNNPYACDAKNYCWSIQRQIPEYSIFNIFNLGSKKQIQLCEKNIVNIDDVPDDYEMTENQKQQVKRYKEKKIFINKEEIKKFCSNISFPIYYLDFETYQQAIPKYKGIKPYQQIPFQYSIHIEDKYGTIEHKEFLAISGADPREFLSKSLCNDIPKGATVLAYNMSFEKSVIEKLALEFEYLSDKLLSINENMQDLMIPFQKRWYTNPNMKGSYSIKYVLPAIVKDMSKSYEELDTIQNGSQAMNAYANMDKMKEDEKKMIRESLLEYCKLDTLAMVKILEKLREISDD